ncbi:MAG: hypothetical protein ASARMPREDX12_003095 [Alectoria sarmentosa]|nr:MAG: hypothetical protein ASARMPREDX12_003095 [Alectoria sarmentosa]
MTTTVPFMTASASASSASSAAGMTATTANNGLSAGAIAGIVIGVLLGLFLLFLFCAFYCFKGLLDGILSFFGLRNKRRRTEVIEEERYSHHGRASGGGGRTWYGGTARPARVDRPKQDGLGGFFGVAGILGALAIFLGLKRRRDRKAKTETTASTYSYSDFSSETSHQIEGREIREEQQQDDNNVSEHPSPDTASHESHYDPPSGWLFGVPPGEKYKNEGWENSWVYGFWGSLLLGIVAYAYKPDTSIQTWALEEARRRLEAEGILPDPDDEVKK